MNNTEKKSIFVIIAALLFLTGAPSVARAENISNRLQPPAQIATTWHVATGYFLPKEGDLDGGPLFGLGVEFTDEKDTLFADFLYSPTDVNLGIPAFDRADNMILQAGILPCFGKFKEARIGIGVQVHRMKFTGSARGTRTTFLGLAEYDLSGRWTLRLQSSQSLKKDEIRFGSYAAVLQYDL